MFKNYIVSVDFESTVQQLRADEDHVIASNGRLHQPLKN